MAKDLDYPWLRKVAWRFGRVFLAAFLVVVAANLDSIESWESFYPIVLYPALVAGISALAKALREFLAADDYTNRLHKLPL